MRLATRIISVLGIITSIGCTSVEKSSNEEALYTKMTPDDVLIANQTVQRALENTVSGTRLSWKSRVTGNSGSITPISTFRSKSGFFCRNYGETITIGNQSEYYKDTACRDSDGLWRPVLVE